MNTPNKETAKSKEQIASAISSSGNYLNVCHVTEALSQESIIQEVDDKPGYFCTVEGSDFSHILEAPDTIDPSIGNYQKIRNRHLELLNRIKSPLSVPKKPGKFSTFKPKGFRIQYELAYI